jgi:hypothetical protein
MVPAASGRHVVHHGGEVRHDGARAGETIIQVGGMGPATSTPAEER